jgi:post-segregation antitoxin (ccd killing protein)
MAKTKADYKVVQVSTELHELLKGHCKEYGLKMSALVESLILNDIKARKLMKESREQWETKRLLAELFNIELPTVDSVTPIDTNI